MLPLGPTAVLPFRDLRGDRSQAMFADAMTGDIVTGLAQCSTLFVVSSGEAADPTAERDVDPVELGKKLGVR